MRTSPLFRSSLVAVLALAAASLSGCSNFWIAEGQKLLETEPAQQQARASLAPEGVAEAAEKSATSDQLASVEAGGGLAQIPGVEVMWGVPLKAVEVYHLYYGSQPNRLDSQVTVPVDKLERLDHPAHGPVYRYRLRGVATAEPVYVAIRAENSAGVSEATAPFRLEPK